MVDRQCVSYSYGAARRGMGLGQDENDALRKKLAQDADENDALRKRVSQYEVPAIGHGPKRVN